MYDDVPTLPVNELTPICGLTNGGKLTQRLLERYLELTQLLEQLLSQQADLMAEQQELLKEQRELLQLLLRR